MFFFSSYVNGNTTNCNWIANATFPLNNNWKETLCWELV